jgi:HK97 family phage major capsid protein
VDRLYSLIQIKSADDEQRIIRGVASTPTPDRVDDVVEPAGIRFKNPLPFILHHDKTAPIGTVTFDRPTAAGVTFTARIPKVVEPGIVKDRTDEAWHSAKYGLLRGVSIGYLPIEADRRATGGRHLKRIEVFELSMVTVPANAETTILHIKSLDAAALAASGRTDRSPSPPGVPGNRQRTAMQLPISEQVTAAKQELETKSARMTELSDREDTDGGLSADESTELQTLTTDVDAYTKRLARLLTQEAAAAALASPAYPARESQTQKRIETPRVEVKELPKGTLFTRYAMAIAAGKGSYSDTMAFARRWDGQSPEVSRYIKGVWGMDVKAIAGTAVVGSPAWGGELAYPQNLASEFVDLLRAATIIGRLQNLRSVPFNVRVGVQTGGSTVDWVGEGGVKPVGELAFIEALLSQSKVAGIVVLSDELIRLSSPSAEQTVRTDLTNAVQQFIDEQLLDPAVTATANRPASLTNGVTGTPASGTTAADFRTDMNAILGAYDAAGLDTTNVTILMTPALARGLSSQTNALGQPEFPGLNPNGGTIMGFPVIVSASVPAGNIIAVKADEVWLADDGQVTLDASNQATLDMSGGSSPNFNLWQRNCTAIRAERWIRWQKRRTAAVQRITGAAYVP